MRADMFKVIVERPRRGGGGDRVARWRFADPEDGGPTHEGMRRAHTDRKGLNENLNPLRRFLERSVGKYWNKVYAEVCEHLAPGNTVQQHVRDHVEDFVAIRTAYIRGKVWVFPHRFGRPQPIDKAWEDFYVHPKSGVLLRNKHAGRLSWVQRAKTGSRVEAVCDRRRDLPDGRQLHRLNGIWYEVMLAMIPRGSEVHDLVRGFSVLEPTELFGRVGVYAASKRQLSARELKSHGLVNDAQL
jgi:hypothetical protein